MTQQPLRVLTFDDNGEVVRDTTPPCAPAASRRPRGSTQELAIERLTRSYEGTVANLKRELDQFVEQDAQSGGRDEGVRLLGARW